MDEEDIKEAIRKHRKRCPNEKRTDEELRPYVISMLKRKEKHLPKEPE
jgi:hypothetical protein